MDILFANGKEFNILSKEEGHASSSEERMVLNLEQTPWMSQVKYTIVITLWNYYK